MKSEFHADMAEGWGTNCDQKNSLQLSDQVN